MKVTPKGKDEDNWVALEYPLWPGEGHGTATITEWDNGEGFDVSLDGTKIELTTYELLTISVLYQLHAIKNMQP